MTMLVPLLLGVCLLLLIALVLVILAGRKRKLREAEVELYRDAFVDISEKSNDAILIVDIADGRIHYANPAAAELLGYTPLQMKRQTIFQLHPESLLQLSAEKISMVWEQGGLIYEDLPFRRADGELLPVECSGKVISYLGRPTILINARDIRERLRLQAEILAQKEEIEEKNQDIIDSITHARRIQTALLPPMEAIRQMLPQSFVYYQPKDIVSGDFYYFNSLKGQAVLAAVDCTGHGVPGAFMSVVGYTGLNEVLRELDHDPVKGIDPSQVLVALDARIRQFLGQDEDQKEIKDGMDVCLTVLTPKTGGGYSVAYAGAFRPLYVFRGGEFVEYKGSKHPIGGHADAAKEFETHHFDLMPGDRMYLFSDGITDQFGGPNGRKFSPAQLRQVLTDAVTQPLENQRALVHERFEAWRGDRAQIDDVMLLGVGA